jgi:hypothetical protein
MCDSDLLDSRVRGNHGGGSANRPDFGETDFLVKRAVCLTVGVSADSDDGTYERASIDVNERGIIFNYSKKGRRELLGFRKAH